MRNQPILVSILVGIIVIFVIVGASLVAKLSSVSRQYKASKVTIMDLEELNEQLTAEKNTLEQEKLKLQDNEKVLSGLVDSLQEEVATLQIKVDKLSKIKEVLEEKLRKELLKPQSVESLPEDTSQQ